MSCCSKTNVKDSGHKPRVGLSEACVCCERKQEPVLTCFEEGVLSQLSVLSPDSSILGRGEAGGRQGVLVMGKG